jgi:type IV secretion system protein VirD4
MAYRLAYGDEFFRKLLGMMDNLNKVLSNPIPSFDSFDLTIGVITTAIIYGIVYSKKKNAKLYRKDIEYGSARWGKPIDIKPFMDKNPENNIILTQTEGLMMNPRPSGPKYARNKNMLVIGGSGSGKTRFVLKPNLMQCRSKDFPVSFVITDPKGSLIEETGKMLQRQGYRIKVLNTINFSKSLHYNPFVHLNSEQDILKLVTTLISNTNGDKKGGDPFWEKAEILLYTALIAYLYYESPPEERNFSTLAEMISAMEVREDDETFKNTIDHLFDGLAERKPECFAVRQYAKFKLSAGVVSCQGHFNNVLKQQESRASAARMDGRNQRDILSKHLNDTSKTHYLLPC